MLEPDAGERVRHDPGKAKALENIFEDSGIHKIWGVGFMFWRLIFWDLFFEGLFFFILDWSQVSSLPLVIKSWMKEQLQEHPCASLQSHSLL